VNRRLVIAGVLVLGLGGGFVSSALAASPDSTRHKICVNLGDPGSTDDGLCVNWVGPIQPE
jgi:hypothetical protein